jgi:hypothetical protein
VASAVALGVAALMFSFVPQEPAKAPAVEVTQSPVKSNPVRVAQGNTSPKKVKKVTTLKKPKPVKVEPYVVPSNDLMVSFPEPTPITIELTGKPSYVKLSFDQKELEDAASNWNCVVDKNSGLTWEKKTSDRGLRDAQNFYSWYNPNQTANGGFAGVADNGKCRGGIDCDTHAYIKAVNDMKLCGYTDWRLPTRAELMTLVQYSGTRNGKGLIDSRYFPGAASDWYWASDSDFNDPRYAWFVLYFNGKPLRASKSEAKRVRLVRSSNERSMRNMAKASTAVASKPAPRDNSITSVRTSPSDS